VLISRQRLSEKGGPQTTPAMTAGITDHVCSIDDFGARSRGALRVRPAETYAAPRWSLWALLQFGPVLRPTFGAHDGAPQGRAPGRRSLQAGALGRPKDDPGHGRLHRGSRLVDRRADRTHAGASAGCLGLEVARPGRSAASRRPIQTGCSTI
jgi:hypothetical protein